MAERGERDTTMNNATDILFITHMEVPRDSGDPRAYDPLRHRVAGQQASIPWLRALAAGEDPAVAMKNLAARRAAFGMPPVLTPFYMQSYMERRGLSCADISCLEMGLEQVRTVLAGGIGLIALSTSWLAATGGADAIRRAAARLRELAPGVPIVAGGVGVRKGLQARKLLKEGWFGAISKEELARLYLLVDARQDRLLDAIVYSEGGEATLAEIARRIKSGQDFRDLPNLAIPGEDDYRFNPSQEEISDIDGERVDWSRYADRLRFFEAPIRTALGCPFRCEFCDFFGLYQSRLRSLDSLLAELRTVPSVNGAPRRVFFTDDNVAINRKRLVELTRAIAAEKLSVAWRSFIRADVIDAETADLLKESGCAECLLGLESGDAGILQNMRKRLDPEQSAKAVALLDARGISTQCTFVIGFPGETAKSLSNTAALISSFPSGDRAQAIHRYYMFPFTVTPLCPVAGPQRRAEYGLTGLGEQWKHSTMSSEDAIQAMREVFLQVEGASHLYLEFRPPEWSLAASRRVMELRDRLQKQHLRGEPAEPETLLAAVREAELGARR